MIIKSQLKNGNEKKYIYIYILHNFSFYIYQKIYKKTHEIKKILTIKLIFHYKDNNESTLSQ